MRIGVIINPGTHADDSATLANAEIIAKRTVELWPGVTFERMEGADFGGWFAFTFKANGLTTKVDIPGDDPDTVCAGTPWVSRRLYVNGSSWLYGFAVGFIQDYLNLEIP